MRIRGFLFAVVALMSATFGAAQVSATSSPIGGGVHHVAARYIVSIVEGVAPTTVMADHGIFNSDSLVYSKVVNAFSAELTGAEADSLAADARVTALDVNQQVQLETTQTTGPPGTYGTPNTTMPWGLDRIDQRTAVVPSDPSKQSFTYTHSGVGVKAYVLDTGLKGDHPEFTGRVANGWSYRAISSSASATFFTDLGSCKVDDPTSGYVYKASDHPYDVDAFDSTYTPSDVGSPDNEGHGTHVSGTIGGTTTGVAKGVTLVPVRVLNSCGGGNTDTVLQGLQWIATNHVDGQPAVANMSIGFGGTVSSVDTAIKNLMEEGIVVVAAAGNSHSSSCGTPATTYGTISVGASDSYDNETWYTNYGNCVDLLAPGSTVLSSGILPTTPYLTMMGTSMASPHVAGVAAVVLETHPEIQTNTTLINQDFSGRKIGRAMFVWNWIRVRATKNAINYYNANRSPQSPNLLLNLSSPQTPAGVQAPDNFGTISWTKLDDQEGSYTAPDVNDLTNPYRNMSFNDITYTATAMPGNHSCSTTATSCKITGLTYGQSYSVTVTANNLIGDSNSSTSVLVTMATSTPDLDIASDTGVSSTDDVTSDNTPTLSAIGAASGEIMTITATKGAVQKSCNYTIGSATSCTLPTLADGTWSVVSTRTDASQSVSSPSVPLNLLIDTVAPSTPGAPDLVASSDTGTSDTDDITSDNAPAFTAISGDIGDTVRITATKGASTPDCSYQVGVANSCRISALADGIWTVAMTLTDLAGNTSQSSSTLNVTIDTIAPNTILGIPDLVASSDTGTSDSDNLTSISDPTISVSGGTSGDYIVVTASNGSRAFTCHFSVPQNSCSLPNLSDGVWSIVASVSDSAGNLSPQSSELKVTINLSLLKQFEAPVDLVSLTSNSAVVLKWSAVAKSVTYVVTEKSTGKTCVTTDTTCTFDGLTNGVPYTFTVVTKTASGVTSAVPTELTARPGFIVKKTSVAKKSKTLLSAFVTTPSKGVKKWSETGKCSIVKGRLVAPKAPTVCKVTLRVAKAGKYPAMKTTVEVTVQ